MSSRTGLQAPQLRRRRYWLLIAALFVICYLFPLRAFYLRSLVPTFVDAPRAGEAFVSDEEFFACVAERLSFKSDDARRIPYVLMPVTMDYQDLKQFFCNLTAPMTYVMFINNGEFKPLRGLLDRLEKRLDVYMDKSLFIIHHPENTGYSGAVNEGLRHAMRFSVKEVPWVMIANADVRFAASLVPSFVEQVGVYTRDQEQVIQSLDEEVAQEAVTATNVSDRRFTYRSSQYPIITATSLPYRIRSMPPQEMRKQFVEHYGMFFPTDVAHMAAFAMSRLLLATVGFFDENYYPTYGEDHDYVWRLEALGFQLYKSPKGQFIHFENANIGVNRDIGMRGIAKSTAYTIQSMKYGRMSYQPFRLHYRRTKWFPGNPVLEAEKGRQPLPFSGQIPVDMWVLDEKRRNSIWKIGENELCRGDYQYYNTSLLKFNVSPS